MDIGWNFPTNNNGDTIGIADAGIETFNGRPFESLAREICQNSLDARLDMTQPVKVEFILSQPKMSEIPGMSDLSKVIDLCKLYWKDNKKALHFFFNAVNICQKENIRVLRISDYNTTGLKGSDKFKDSPWQDLVKSSGVSNKTGDQGGSFGIGKSAPLACSDLRTVFYNTIDIDGLRAYQGIAKLVSFQYPDENGSFHESYKNLTQGKGYFGIKETNSCVRSLFPFPNYTRKKVGTDVFIIGFSNHSEWQNKIINAVLENFLVSIFQKDLEVIVGDTHINKQNISTLIELQKETLPLAYNYYQVLTDPATRTVVENFEDLGNLEFKLLIKQDFRKRILMARNNGMKIFDKGHISASIHFAGICILRGQNLNEYFRQMENPQHDAWEPDRFSDEEAQKKEAEKRRKKLFQFLRNKVLELGRETILEETDALGAGEFIPDIEPVQGSNENKTEQINDQITSIPILEKADAVPTKKGSNPSLDSEIYTETPTFGDIREFGTSSTSSLMKRKQNKVAINDAPSESRGDISQSGEDRVNKKIYIHPLKLRIFIADVKQQLYKLSFTPNQDAKNACIEILISGEQSNSGVQIKNVINLNHIPLIFQQNKIFIGDIKKGTQHTLFFSIKEGEMRSMEVIVYGYKI